MVLSWYSSFQAQNSTCSRGSDLTGRTLTRLTPGLGADAQYVGQADAGKHGVLIAVRHPYTSSFQLQSVTPGGALLAE